MFIYVPVICPLVSMLDFLQEQIIPMSYSSEWQVGGRERRRGDGGGLVERESERGRGEEEIIKWFKCRVLGN